jgi:hypothetical protein
MDDAGLIPIGHLRGGAGQIRSYGRAECALTWIEGETERERFRVAIPTSRWFSGWDQNNRRHERSITAFNGTTILPNGSLRLTKTLWIGRVEFDIPPLTFVLTDVQKHIALLVSEFLNISGHSLPTKYVDYVELGKVKLTSFRPVADFVRSNWHRDGVNTPSPSRETIAATLEALFMRSRSRQAN